MTFQTSEKEGLWFNDIQGKVDANLMIFSKINSRWLSNINVRIKLWKYQRNVAKCYFNPSIEEEGPRLIKKKKSGATKEKGQRKSQKEKSEHK